MNYSETDLPPLLVQMMRTTDAPAKEKSVSQRDLIQQSIPPRADRFFDSISLNESLLLYSAVRKLRPNATAEIGFCCGGSGMAITKALEDNGEGMHYACDPFQESFYNSAGVQNVEAAGLGHRLKFLNAFPESAVPAFPRVQFAFIDASHMFDLSILDFIMIDKRLDVGGLVGFHDLWMPSLQKLMRYILSNRSYSVHRIDVPAAPRPRIVKRLASAMARRIPKSTSIFAPEFLVRWEEIGLPGNLALLEKTGEDERDWRHFVRF